MNIDTETIQSDRDLLHPVEVLLAGTLVLMTGHAQACSETQRHKFEESISANLSHLAGQAILSSQFRMALWTLTSHWQSLVEQRDPASSVEKDHRLWHTAPASVH